jgi:hypothetical protein
VESKRRRIRRVKYATSALAILAALSVSLALAEDFTTTNGKEYKNAALVRVDPDGIVIRTKSAIVKLSWWELPKDVADKWLEPMRAAERAAEENRIKEQQAAEEKRTAAEREATEKETKADAELKRAVEQFQAAEQRASKAYESAAKGTVSGQVFVSSEGGENFKLGAVQVGLFARDAIDTLVAATKKNADYKIEEVRKAVAAAEASQHYGRPGLQRGGTRIACCEPSCRKRKTANLRTQSHIELLLFGQLLFPVLPISDSDCRNRCRWKVRN